MKKTLVGYTGGVAAKPTYKSVCGGDGHTEAIRIEFDPDQVSYTKLLDKFFQSHNPRATLVQYKSAIWYADDEQKELAMKAIQSKGANAQQFCDLAPASTWYNAEEYHQKYIEKMRTSRY